MDTYTARKIVSLSALAAAFIGAPIMGGCANNELPPIGANERFQADDTPRDVDYIFAQQQANGARDDGTLYPQHFTGGKLNSLGYAKLSAMTYGKQDGKLAIFIDVPKGEPYAAAQDSVMKALTRGGMKEDEYTITAGPNLGVSSPAAPGLNSMSKLHGGADAGAAADAASAAPPAK